MGSTRLPKKSMMSLGGKPLVDHMLQRLKLAKNISTVVLALPDTPDNESLAERAKANGVECFRGSENDLVDRYYQAACQYKADVVVRACADNPLIHPTEVDRIISYFLESDVDFASNVNNVMGNGYPDGLGAEVMSFDALKWVYENVRDARRREHPHESFYGNKERFKLGTVKCPAEFSFPEIILDINTADEYKFISRLFNELQEGDDLIHISKIIPWYRANYHLIPETYKK